LTPTKSQVLHTDPQKVLDLIDGWTKAVDTLEQQAETYKKYVDRPGGSYWEGKAAEAAQNHAGQDLKAVAAVRDTVDQGAGQVRNAVSSSLMPPLSNAKNIIANAESQQGVTVNEDLSISYTAPEGMSQDTADANKATVAHAEAELKDAANKWWTAENDVASQIRKIEGDVGKDINLGAALYDVRRAFALKPGEIRNLGPIAGTGSGTGKLGVGAVDLGEIIALPDGTAIAVGGDGWKGNWLGKAPDPDHYPSVGMGLTPDSVRGLGPVQLSQLLSGTDSSKNPLFAQYPGRGDTLPAGSIEVNGKTYMMVAGTTDLKPTGGTWLVEAKPGQTGWTEIPKSFQPANYANGGQSQISGFQGKDGKVYIAADSFDRQHGVSFYRADPDTFTDRSTWQPWTHQPDGTHGWGGEGQQATPISRGENFGELSLREVGGKAVLSGFNQTTGSVELRVGDDPTKLFDAGIKTTVVAQPGVPDTPNYVPRNYGGYIVPGSTLDDMRVLVSQWYVPMDAANHPTGPGSYNVQEFAVNAGP